jgi:drug/metabolite transporter (DMT)-like permease
MASDRTTSLASGIVLGTGLAWGLYWIAVRGIEAAGLPGAWGTVAITLGACLCIIPFALRRGDGTAGLASHGFVALGGAAFALYSVGFVQGRVAMVILLWFFSPVWSALIGRFVMGWPTPPLRIAAIVTGLAGLAVLLGADGVPLPENAGEWMSLAGGFLWSISTVGIRVSAPLPPARAALVFAIGAAITALALALLLAPLPAMTFPNPLWVAGLALASGGFWWGLTMAGLLWATVRLDPARVSILLMTEVLVGTLSAALLAGETMTPLEVLGGALILAAGVLEVWPTRGRGPA